MAGRTSPWYWTPSGLRRLTTFRPPSPAAAAWRSDDGAEDSVDMRRTTARSCQPPSCLGTGQPTRKGEGVSPSKGGGGAHEPVGGMARDGSGEGRQRRGRWCRSAGGTMTSV